MVASGIIAIVGILRNLAFSRKLLEHWDSALVPGRANLCDLSVLSGAGFLHHLLYQKKGKVDLQRRKPVFASAVLVKNQDDVVYDGYVDFTVYFVTFRLFGGHDVS